MVFKSGLLCVSGRASWEGKIMKLLRTAIILSSLSTGAAVGHEQWADGTTIPSWVRESCCGPADAHRLTVGQIKHIDEEGGWLVEGHYYIVPDYRVLPSQDGHVWIFYTSFPNGDQSHSYCFFVPTGQF